jgi:hypothetical protein
MRTHEEERRAQEQREQERPQAPVAAPHALLALQQSAGNQAVARMLARVRHGQTASKPAKKKGTAKTTEPEDGFDRLDPTTWTLNALEFGKKVTENDVLAAADGAAILDAIRNGTVQVEGKSAVANTTSHIHLNAADWGLMITYIVENDGTVTPWVYDIATKRTGMKYHWSIGKPAYNSPVQPPTKK